MAWLEVGPWHLLNSHNPYRGWFLESSSQKILCPTTGNQKNSCRKMVLGDNQENTSRSHSVKFGSG